MYFLFDLAFMVNRFVNGGQIKAIAFYCGDFYSACFSSIAVIGFRMVWISSIFALIHCRH